VKAGVADGQAVAGVYIEPDGPSPQVAANMNGNKASEPPAKKRKKSTEPPYTDVVEYYDEEYEAGTGPLPFGAEDGFDPRIILDQATGKVVYKSKDQMDAQKMVPTGETRAGETLNIWTDGSSLGNGKQGAIAGVGVWFGPSDDRSVLFTPLPSLSHIREQARCLCNDADHLHTGTSPNPSSALAKPTNAPNSPPSNAPSTLRPSTAPSRSTPTAATPSTA